MRINEFTPDLSLFDKIGAKQETEDQSSSFAELLNNKLNEVNDAQINAEQLTEGFVKGDATDVHQVMLAGEEAKMSLELAVQLRNKFVEAYQEINRTQI